MQYKTNRNQFQDIDISFAFMTGFLLLGVIFGTLSYCFMSEGTVELLSKATKGYIDFRKSSDFGHILIDSFLVSSLFIGIEFIFGLSALGQLPELFVLLYRGSGLGIILSQAYDSIDKSKLVLVILLIVPSCIVSCYALCVAAKEAVRMSGRLLRLMAVNRPVLGLLDHFKNYSARFAAIEAMAAVSAALDCILSLTLASKI